MKSIRYKKWDGSQEPFDLNRKSIVDTFLDNIIKGMNPRTSLAQMMWSGFPLAGMNFRVMGLEEMIIVTEAGCEFLSSPQTTLRLLK